MTDDQIIDISLAWELWLRLDMIEPVARFASALVERLALRKALGFPLPSLWHRARVPMRSEDLKVIVEAHARGRAKAPSSFTDDGSTLLPFAVYLAARLGKALEPSWLEAFRPAKSAESDRAWAVFPQSWQPPPDAANEWYTQGIEHRGTCKVFDLGADMGAFLKDFAGHGPPAAPLHRRVEAHLIATYLYPLRADRDHPRGPRRSPRIDQLHPGTSPAIQGAGSFPNHQGEPPTTDFQITPTDTCSRRTDTPPARRDPPTSSPPRPSAERALPGARACQSRPRT